MPVCSSRSTRLAPLREEDILVLGSGNLVHNLHAYAWGRHVPEPYDWAVSFESRVRDLLLAGDYKPLVNYEHQLGSEAELAVPHQIIISLCSTLPVPARHPNEFPLRA
jgi:aromatic ring-opening dioxygenase catalytic subunit (LigB family)